MNSEMQLKVQAYLDNELSPADARKVATWITSDPATRNLYNELKETKEIVACNEPEAALSDSREFYWSKIERAIAAGEREPSRAEARPWWMRLVAPVAGAVAIFAVLLAVVDRGGKPINPSQSASALAPLHEVEQSPEVSTITFRSEAEGVTVVWLSTQ